MDQVIYTYEASATPQCHAYTTDSMGALDEAQAEELASQLRQQHPDMTVMVLPAEELLLGE